MTQTPSNSELQDKGTSEGQTLGYNDIADQLLKDKFLLTALELYSELTESGKQIPRLTEYFSNPENFEEHMIAFPKTENLPLHQWVKATKPLPKLFRTREKKKKKLANNQRVFDVVELARSSSQATLDSLDMTRLSEDGEQGLHETIAVLEFELRKAKETIIALRANLTVATTTNGANRLPDCKESLQYDPIKPHEQRALNFLINEYLLAQNYKLTSITFADENEGQDFEDWDDVGLNIPKPSELLQLYRVGTKPSSATCECTCKLNNSSDNFKSLGT